MMERPFYIRIPCGSTQGHGETCHEGHLCGQCHYILGLEQEIRKYKTTLEMIDKSMKGEA